MHMKYIRYIIPKEYDGGILKDFLKNWCNLSSRSITLLKRENLGISRNGILIRTVDTVRAGDEIVLKLPEDRNNIKPVSGILSVKYEDDHLILLDKPAFMPVHPTKIHQEDTLANLLVTYMLIKDEHYTFRAVNRLDRDTSGIVMIGKNRVSAYQLQKNTQKTYYAICEGVIREAGTIDAPIKVKEGRSIQRVVSPDGERAVTHYRPLRTYNNCTLLEIVLETGRTHQIRCHFSSIGHPLCGDDMYGGQLGLINRQALHCGKIEFIHPFTGNYFCISSDMPDDMLKILSG